MGRMLTVITVLLLLGACSRSPEFVVHDQVLDWPALDSVTDIRSQLVFDGEEYLLAGELSILSLKDTLPSSEAEILYTFHDSLWEYHTQMKWPGRKTFRPAEIDDDYFRNMPDFYINRIFPFDKENALILLVFNALVSEPEFGGLGARKHHLAFLFNKKSHEMVTLSGLPHENRKIGEITYRGEFDDLSSIKVIKTDNGYIPYSTSCLFYRDSIHLDNTPGIVCYNMETNQMEFYVNPPDTATWTLGKLLTKKRTIYALTEHGASVLVLLDTTDSDHLFLRDAAFFSPNDPDVCAVRLIWDEARAEYTLQLALVDQKGKEKIFHEIVGVTIPGRTLYETDHGELIFFYEKDVQIHQLNISKQ